MARLPIQTIESATGTNKDNFAALKKALGMVPNMPRVMAASPAVLQSWVQFNTAMNTSTLSPQIREQIALLVADANDCTYCLSVHSLLGKKTGLSQPQIDAARHAESADPRTQAALTFARTVLDTRGGIGDREVSDVRAAGFSDAEIAEIVGAVALNIFTNIFNRAFDTDVDFPRVEAHGHANAR